MDGDVALVEEVSGGVFHVGDVVACVGVGVGGFGDSVCGVGFGFFLLVIVLV